MDTVAHQAMMKQMVEEFWQQQRREMDDLEIGTEQVSVARAPACARVVACGEPRASMLTGKYTKNITLLKANS